ncbi:MAG: PDZ domain-containing protein [Firmicutes bacterium]|nr:PDZ domain-containing protein [Bacillota bacterium]
MYYHRSRSGSNGIGLFIAALAGAIVGGLLVGLLLINYGAGLIPQSSSGQQGQVPTPGTTISQEAGDAARGHTSQGQGGAGAEVVRTELFSAASAAQKVGPSVVKISTKQEEVVYSFFFTPMVQVREGLGSGVIIDSSGYILTNNHVVQGVSQIAVMLADGRQFDARIVGTDPYTDLAVIKVDATDLPVAELGDSDKLVPGEPAIAIGNPYGFDHTITAGVVSALNRTVEVSPSQGIVLEGLIQTDAPINPGNSGGALVTVDGRVVGINTAIIEEAQGIGLAIPINMARQVADQIIRYGKVPRPYLGVSEVVPLTAARARRYGLPVDSGLYIVSVVRNSPADRAGLRQGDIIIEMNGVPVTSVDDVRKTLLKSSVGDVVKFTVIGSNNRQRVLEVTLSESA